VVTNADLCGDSNPVEAACEEVLTQREPNREDGKGKPTVKPLRISVAIQFIT
jgi:hypothetical protein